MQNSNGKLQLNSTTIFTRNYSVQRSEASVVHELAPMLFLERMTERETDIQQMNMAFIDAINEQVFLFDYSADQFKTSQLVAELFQTMESPLHFNNVPMNRVGYIQFPVWLIILILVIGGSIVNYIAVRLGSRFSHLFLRRGGDTDGVV